MSARAMARKTLSGNCRWLSHAAVRKEKSTATGIPTHAVLGNATCGSTEKKWLDILPILMCLLPVVVLLYIIIAQVRPNCNTICCLKYNIADV